MMMVPLDCSLFYTAHPALLRSAFSLEAEYLKTDAVGAVDFMNYGLALGRRFRALKLWFVMRYFGREGLAAILRENIRMAAWLGERIAADARFELAAPAAMGLVCFRLRQGDDATRELMRRISISGRFFLLAHGAGGPLRDSRGHREHPDTAAGCGRTRDCDYRRLENLSGVR